jgi:DNA-binding XRE family transcriptional regulator
MTDATASATAALVPLCELAIAFLAPLPDHLGGRPRNRDGLELGDAFEPVALRGQPLVALDQLEHVVADRHAFLDGTTPHLGMNGGRDVLDLDDAHSRIIGCAAHPNSIYCVNFSHYRMSFSCYGVSMSRHAPEVRLSLGRALRRIRRERDLSQEALADRAGLSTNYVSEIERALKDASFATVVHLADALGMTLPELMRAFDQERARQAGSGS